MWPNKLTVINTPSRSSPQAGVIVLTNALESEDLGYRSLRGIVVILLQVCFWFAVIQYHVV